MAKQTIDLVTIQPNGKKGEPATTAFDKINKNFTELYNEHYAAKGANSDITSLSGLTTPLSIVQGGTGANTAVGAIRALGGIAIGRETGSSGTTLSSGGLPAFHAAGDARIGSLLISNQSNPAAVAAISFIREGSFGAHFGLDTTNEFCVGGWSMGNRSCRLYHSGNTTRAADGTLRAI